MYKVATPPIPPDCVTSMPASCDNKVGTSLACERSISARVIKLVSGCASSMRCAVRLAVTTVSGKLFWAAPGIAISPNNAADKLTSARRAPAKDEGVPLTSLKFFMLLTS